MSSSPSTASPRTKEFKKKQNGCEMCRRGHILGIVFEIETSVNSILWSEKMLETAYLFSNIRRVLETENLFDLPRNPPSPDLELAG
jgi:hypothetical protein